MILLLSTCRPETYPNDDCDKSKITSSFLFSAAEANEYISKNDNAIIIQVSKPSVYRNEHLPNSINIWRPDFRSSVDTVVTGLRCSKTELEELLSRIGVDKEKLLIVYDNKGSVDAFRFTWVLDYYGFQNHKVLNGGLVTWKESGYPTTKEQTKPLPSKNFKIEGSLDTQLLANMNDVYLAINDTNTIIIDTREPYEFLGQPYIYKNEILPYKKGAYAAGAIPSAVHLNWSVLSDLGNDHRIKCEKDLKYDLARKGITRDKKIIVYCQSGSRSSHTAFVLRHILNYPNVKNYDGSWIEWSFHSTINEKIQIDQKTDSEAIEELRKELESKKILIYE